MELLITVGAAVVGLLLLALVLRMLWRVAEPNEALIISGFRARSSPGEAADSLEFKIVTGKGALVIPGFQAARRLSLDTRGTSLQVSCVTEQGIPVAVCGVVIYKVGDDPRARRGRRGHGARPRGGVLAKALAMGGTGLGLARTLLASMGDRTDHAAGNGAAPPLAKPAADAATP